MDVSFLLNQYFKGDDNVTIDVFDAITLNDIYSRVMTVLTSHLNIELSVLQSLSYCFYEILDNVHIHSGKPLGTAITHYDDGKGVLKVLVADDGMGICESLRQNPIYSTISEEQALSACLNDSVTDGKGMGFGLFATLKLIQSIGIRFILYSGSHKLIISNGKTSVQANGLWHGTIVYLEVSTNVDFDPQNIVMNRTDVASEYNEQFIDTEELSQLW